VPSEILELAADREPVVVLTAPWLERETQRRGHLYSAGDRLPIGIEAFPGREHNDLVLWIESRRAVVAGDAPVDFGRGLEIPLEWLRKGVTPDLDCVVRASVRSQTTYTRLDGGAAATCLRKMPGSADHPEGRLTSQALARSVVGGGAPRSRRAFEGEQGPNPKERGFDVRRATLEVGEQLVRKFGEHRGVKVLGLVGVLPSLRTRPVERGLQLADSAPGICLRARVLLVGGLHALPQIADHLPPRFCEGKSLLTGGDEV